jgi:malate dehydrogenase (oxaloacetate-decarboxylating)
MSPAQANPNANLLPPVTSLRDVSAAVALAVARQAHNEGLTEGINTDEIEGSIRANIWVPRYLPYRRVRPSLCVPKTSSV